MNAADRRRFTPVLAVLAVVLALLLVALWLGLGRGVRWHDDGTPPRLPPLAAATPPPVVPPLSRYEAVWQQPLFSPDRAPETAAGSGDGTSGNLQLTGVILLPGLKMAIIHDKTTGKDYRVRAGQPTHGGPSLLALHPRSAVVDAAGSHMELELVPGPAPGGSQADAAVDTGGQAVADGDDADAAAQPGRPAMNSGSTPAASAAARARELRERIEARRRQNRQNGGG